MRQKTWLWLCVWVCLIDAGYALQTAPWFGRDKEFEVRCQYSFQTYNKIAVSKGTQAIGSDDHLLTLGVAISPIPKWQVELEGRGAHTEESGLGITSIHFSGRYLWLDDVTSVDPVSLVTAIKVAFPIDWAREDPSLFHRGVVEGTFELSVGKECPKGAFWDWRSYLVVLVGKAGQGAPWLGGEVHLEKNFEDRHRLGIGAKAHYGQGTDHWMLALPFPGYEDLRTRTIDLSAYYSFHFATHEALRLGYQRRLDALNAPLEQHLIALKLYYPFGL